MNKNEYNEIQSKILELTKDIMSDSELKNFTQHMKDKLNNFKPTLMVYGVYNAGKSSLLNALFGQEEIAKTGDIPETKEIHSYSYNGYTIYDTPGLNANNEDDITSQEHLEKSEVVLFVMSNAGSFEEEFVYEKICSVVKSQKPIIIVVNNKTGFKPESIEAKQLMIKVGENIRKIGDREGITNIELKVDICMVNAKTALKAKIENKNILLKKSNIMLLENMIEKKLSNAGSKEVIHALNSYIKNFIDNAIDKIDNKIDNVEAKKVEELITYLEKLKKKSNIDMKNIITSKISSSSMLKEISSMLLNDGSDINIFINDMLTDINAQIENLYKAIESELATKVDGFIGEFNSLNGEYEIPSLSNKPMANDSSITEMLKEQLKNGIQDKEVLESATKFILANAKKYLPKQVMHGKGPKWIEKAAGKAAPVIKGAMAAYEIYSANNEHQKIVENEKNMLMDARNSAETITKTIESDNLANIDEITAETFNPLILEFKDISKKINTDNNQYLNKKESLLSILNTI